MAVHSLSLPVHSTYQCAYIITTTALLLLAFEESHAHFTTMLSSN